MKRPDIENYKLGKGFHTHDFVSDLTLYIDQVEDENKQLEKEKNHLQNYAVHTEFCTWRFDGNVNCDCGLIKKQIEK